MIKILTVIPARGGSKGLPGKNIKHLINKPLIAWSIEQGMGSKYVNEVIVSTDSEEIADIARQYGARVPFLRPSHLAQDTSSTKDVLIHLIEELEKKGEFYDYLLLLEPTSPLRETSDIDASIEILVNTQGARSIVGVNRVERQHPVFCITLTENGFLESKNQFATFRRQDIDELYFYEGSIYLSEIQAYKESGSFYHEQTLGYRVPKWKSFEIDDEVDFIIVEALLKNHLSLKK